MSAMSGATSGWRVYADHTDGDQVQLSVDCYTFNLNTLQFDAKCGWSENKRRAQERADKLVAHNAEMESRRLSTDQVKALTDSGLLFDTKIMTTNVFAPEEPADAVEPTLLDGP